MTVVLVRIYVGRMSDRESEGCRAYYGRDEYVGCRVRGGTGSHQIQSMALQHKVLRLRSTNQSEMSFALVMVARVGPRMLGVACPQLDRNGMPNAARVTDIDTQIL